MEPQDLQDVQRFFMKRGLEPLKEMVESGEISIGHAISLLREQTGTFTDKDHSEEFKKFGTEHRGKEKKGKEVYNKLSKRSELFGNVAIFLLVIALFLLAITKLSII